MPPRSYDFLTRLLDAPGPSGFEAAPARLWREEAGALRRRRPRRRARQLLRDRKPRRIAPDHVRRPPRRDRSHGGARGRRRVPLLRRHRRLGSTGLRRPARDPARQGRPGGRRGRQEGHPPDGKGRPRKGVEGGGPLGGHRREEPEGGADAGARGRSRRADLERAPPAQRPPHQPLARQPHRRLRGARGAAAPGRQAPGRAGDRGRHHAGGDRLHGGRGADQRHGTRRAGGHRGGRDPRHRLSGRGEAQARRLQAGGRPHPEPRQRGQRGRSSTGWWPQRRRRRFPTRWRRRRG